MRRTALAEARLDASRPPWTLQWAGIAGWRLEECNDGDMIVEPEPGNIELLREATVEACQRKAFWTADLMTIVPLWTWFCLS